MVTLKFKNIDFEDLSQVIIGSSVLSVPIAFTEEAWNLSKTIPVLNLGVIIILTLCFIGIYAFKGIFQGHIKQRKATFVKRVFETVK
ncbi:DUF2391 family protein [uncultured Draconibacterium sp.]|uniref:DUF2391 family protein n=1 Tax=uncultured Draconibacterium sp. TaxID=1573823 RepID=UPI0032178203